ncbi:MAG TPA: RluA family pseudouridine synthase [Chitinophagaceae bacterium]|nr:RluA family pseudouridine synthase [Chitinophagaceae bacterium]
MKIEILYEDEDLVVVNKPANVLSIPDRYNLKLFNVYHWAQKRWGQIYTLHRIDKATSGILCLSKTKEALKYYAPQFEKQVVIKEYYAFCKGVPYPEDGESLQKIAPHPTIKGKMHIHPKGKTAHTIYKTLKKWASSYSLIKVRIVTGRTHQIRVHLSNIAAPIIGDELYGDGRGFYLSDVKKRVNLKKDTEEKAILDRLALHASYIAFPEKRNEASTKIEVEAPLPKDFTAVQNQLNKCLRN